MVQPPVSPQFRPASTAAAMQELARRRRRRRARRSIAGSILVVVIGVAAALILTGKAVVPIISEQVYPIRYREYINTAAGQYGVDPYLVAAVAKAESGYDPQAVSPDGAVGLMQLLPETANYITGLRIWKGQLKPNLTSAQDNVELGTCYLAYLEKTFGDNDLAAIAAYNAGEGTVRQWIDEAGGIDAFDLSAIQFSETLGFVRKVQKYRDLYLRIYPNGIVSAAAWG